MIGHARLVETLAESEDVDRFSHVKCVVVTLFPATVDANRRVKVNFYGIETTAHCRNPPDAVVGLVENLCATSPATVRAVFCRVSGAVSDQRDTAGSAATGANSSSLVNGDGAVVRSSEDAFGFEVL